MKLWIADNVNCYQKRSNDFAMEKTRNSESTKFNSKNEQN